MGGNSTGKLLFAVCSVAFAASVNRENAVCTFIAQCGMFVCT